MGARFQVCFTPLPGFFSPFPRGTCPLSVTVSCLALEGGPPCFGRGFACPALLGMPRGDGWPAYGALTLFRPAFQPVRPPRRPPLARSRNPGAHAPRFGLSRFRSPLLARSRLISSPPGTEMFHFPGSGARRPCVRRRAARSRAPGSPIRAPADRRALAPPRGFSQLAAPFVAARCQGIRRAPVCAWPEGRGSRPPRLRRHPSPRPLPRTSSHSPSLSTLLSMFPDVRLSKNGPRGRPRGKTFRHGLVGVPGIGPGTSSLSGTRSNRLSYTPSVVEAAGLEPATSGLQSRRSAG